MLATYMRRMRNSNLEIRIARSSCRAQLVFWKKKTIGIIFNWDISTTHRPPRPPPQTQNLSGNFKNYCRSPLIKCDRVKFGVLTVIK